MLMKAEAGVWLTAAAVLAVAATCWPATAAAAAAAAPAAAADKSAQELCKELGCDPDDDVIWAEDIVENITDLLGLNISDKAHEGDFNHLMDELTRLTRRTTKIDKNAKYKDKTKYWYAIFIPEEEYPPYKYSMPFPPRDMRFVPQPRDLSLLYNASPYFLDAIVPHQKREFVWHVVSDAFDVSQYTVRIILWGLCGLVALLAGPIAFVIMLLTTVAMMVIAALTARRRNVRPIVERRDFDRKCDGQLKRCLAIVLLATGALYGCGLWGYYLSEQQLEEGVKNFTVAVCNLTRSLNKDGHKTMMAMFQRVYPWEPLPREVPERDYISTMDMWFYYNKDPMENLMVRRRSAVTSLSNMAGQLDAVQRDLRGLKDHGAKLWLLAEQLNAELREVKRSLLQAMVSCDQPACVELVRRHRFLEIDTQLPNVQVPDVSEVLHNVSELREQRLRQEMANGRRNIDEYGDISLDNDTVHYITHYNQSINIAFRLGHIFIRRAWRWYQGFWETLESFESDRTTFLNAYLPVISAIFIGIIAFMTLPVLLLLGLPHCFAGVRATEPGKLNVFAPISRAVGSQCLYTAILFSMVSFAVCVLATAIFFIMATLLQRGFCEPLEDPLNSAMFAAIIDPFVDVEKQIFKEKANRSSSLKFSYVYYHMMHPVAEPPAPFRRQFYWTFHLDRIAGEQKHTFIFTKKLLRSLKEMQKLPPKRARPNPVKILSDSAKQNLRKLGDIRFLDLPIDRVPIALKDSVAQYAKTSREMASLADALERVARRVAAGGGYGALPGQLRAAAAALTQLRLDTVLPMFQHAHALNNTVKRLQELVRFNVSQTSLRSAIDARLDEVAEAERFLNEGFDDETRSALRQKSRDITGMVMPGYRHHIARVTPIYNFFIPHVEQVRRTLCENVLFPLHGMWLCLAVCWLMLHAMLLVSRNLARICLHTAPYPGPAVMRAYDAVKRYARETRKKRLSGQYVHPCLGSVRAQHDPDTNRQLPPQHPEDCYDCCKHYKDSQ